MFGSRGTFSRRYYFKPSMGEDTIFIVDRVDNCVAAEVGKLSAAQKIVRAYEPRNTTGFEGVPPTFMLTRRFTKIPDIPEDSNGMQIAA